MKARAGLSIVMWFLVLGAFNACQETSKHKSQSTGSSQVSASSGVPSQGSLSDNRKSSANKATQSNQAQRQQPHSDSFISASKVNSTISTSSSPGPVLPPKPKAITKKQAHDFCHSDWVKQHYPCRKGETCHYTQEQVVDDADPYQCRILPFEPSLAVVLTLKKMLDKEGSGASLYYIDIDLIDINYLTKLDHTEDLISDMSDQFFLSTYFQCLLDPISQKYHFFNIIFEESDHGHSTASWKRKIVNIYQHKGKRFRKLLDKLDLNTRYENQDEEMENKLPKNVKSRCINELRKESVEYRFIPNNKRDMPDLYLSKIIKHKWIRGYHLDYLTPSVLGETMCDTDRPQKVIKKKKDIKQEKRIAFNGKSYVVPKSWKPIGFFF